MIWKWVVRSVNTSNTSMFFCVWLKYLRSPLLSKFQVYYVVFLAIVTVLCIRSSELIHLTSESLYPLTIIFSFHPSLYPLTSLYSTCKYHTILVFLSALFYLAQCPQVSLISQMTGFSSLLWFHNFHCIHICAPFNGSMQVVQFLALIFPYLWWLPNWPHSTLHWSLLSHVIA